MTEHLGYEKHDPAGAGTGNIRNGTRAKTVLTEASGQVEIEVPRDRAGTFEPHIVRKRQRRLNGVEFCVRRADTVSGTAAGARPARHRPGRRNAAALREQGTSASGRAVIVKVRPAVSWFRT